MSAYDILIERGVTRLCHFTLLKNLTHIIASPNGILASNSIRQDIKSVTDTARYDGELNYVCTSVQYPNSWFLQNAIHKNNNKIFTDWVVIYINPSILNCKKAKFCPGNASTKKGAYIEKNMDNINSIFANSVPTFTHLRAKNMLSSCPTDGQAEILIKDEIPKNFISGIAVGNTDVSKRVYAMLRLYNMEFIPIYIAPQVLTPKWSEMVRIGECPKEIQCDWSMEE